MVKCLFLIVLSFLLTSCFYYNNAERMFVWGYLDGPREIFDDYSLEYVLNDKNVSSDFYMTYRDLNYDWNEKGQIKSFENIYCNRRFSGSDVFNCGSPLTGKANFDIFLKNEKNGNRILLAKKTINMDGYFRSVLLTQVYFGTDKEQYKYRTDCNIDWNKVEPIVFPNTNDTLYHYTAWYWDKRDSYENYSPNEKYFVEIP